MALIGGAALLGGLAGVVVGGLFGPSSQTEAVDITQNVTNSILQESQEQCKSSCTTEQSGNTIIINDSTVKSVGITSTCQANAACTMNQTLDAQIKNLMNAYAQQKQSTQHSIFDLLSSNKQSTSAIINQNINNQITQVLSSTCQATSTQIQDNNLTIVNDSKANVVGLSATGNANSTCMMNNLGKAIALNTVSATTKQDQIFKNAFAAIMITIAILLIVGGIILVIILVAFGGGAAVISTAGKKSTTATDPISAALSGDPTAIEAALETAVA